MFFIAFVMSGRQDKHSDLGARRLLRIALRVVQVEREDTTVRS